MIFEGNHGYRIYIRSNKNHAKTNYYLYVWKQWYVLPAML